MMRLVVVLAATTPAAAFKLPWSRSAPKSGGYQLGDISKAVYQTYKNQKDGKASTPAVSDAYDYGYRGRSEFALDMPRAEFEFCPPREMTGVPVEITRACASAPRGRQDADARVPFNPLGGRRVGSCARP